MYEHDNYLFYENFNSLYNFLCVLTTREIDFPAISSNFNNNSEISL